MSGAYQKTLKSLEYNKVLEELANYSRCDYSKRLCLDLEPSKEVSEIQTMLNYTKEAFGVLNMALDIPLNYVIGIEHIDLHPEYFSEDEIIDFGKTLRSFRLVKGFLRDNTEENTKKIH